MVIRCKTCVMPNTRPDTAWVDGECSACISYRRRPEIDWDARKRELVALLDRHDGRCIVPSSAGKDSHYQVLTLLEMGADVTVVTASTCHLTALGRANIDNLARYARTIEVSPNKKVRAKLNRLGLELVGDISHPEHMAIFSTPMRMALSLGIPLIFYGENPQDQYGGPMGSAEAKQMTRRWVSEFGGLLGLRPDDFVGMEGITERDMEDYRPARDVTRDGWIEAHFLGQYIPWDSHRNAEVAIASGMRGFVPLGANKPERPPWVLNWWKYENLDNAQTGLHDFFMLKKFGFSRGCQQISTDVRAGRISRRKALNWVERHEAVGHGADFFDYHQYLGVPLGEVLDRIEMTPSRFAELLDQFTNRELV